MKRGKIYINEDNKYKCKYHYGVGNVRNVSVTYEENIDLDKMLEQIIINKIKEKPIE